MAIRYAVDLTDTERTEFARVISKNGAKGSTIINAYILLKVPNGPVVGQIVTLLWRTKYPPKKC